MIDSSAPVFLQTANRFGIKLGLSRMQALLAKLGDPHKDLRAVHIAGTNGKGSVSAYCAAMLACDGHKVGLYTSPFLERFSERIRILNGKEGLLAWEKDDRYGEIGKDDLERLSAIVEQAVAQLLKEGEEHPTEFELVTAVAFLYFREKHCDYVVLETGLGGRLDSTNVIEKPVCSLITALGYDHMDRLGNTLSEIAGEKGGIIKEGCPVFAMDTNQAAVTAAEAGQARAKLEEIAREKHAPLTFVGNDEAKKIRSDLSGQTFSFDGTEYTTPMHGAYQLSNAGLALRAMQDLVSGQARNEGLLHTRWKGRLEVVTEDLPIILDGAHNPQGITVFCDFLEDTKELKRCRPCELIMGVMADKDVKKMLSILAERWCVPIGRITFVRPEQTRAMQADALKSAFDEVLREGKAFYNSQSCMYNAREKLASIDDATEACRIALDRAVKNRSPLYVIGSLYLLGQVRETIVSGWQKIQEKT
ncbi:MAG: bifunctional folylpolyglutamate synthase/dihydrofolate synthase [Clostridiales bacterium]|nr:bifunctional folylpolyglutamate synthase/dihydrofolate synthase [Clostridiales bacterium]